jgi:PAS domain S-box-containing protein
MRKGAFGNISVPAIKDIQEKGGLNKLWLDAILESSIFSIMLLKPVQSQKGRIIDFEIIFINKTAERSVKKKNLTGKLFLDNFPASKVSGVFDHYADVTKNEKTWHGEVHIYDDEIDVWFLVNASSFNGNCLVMYTDVTPQKAAELKLMQMKELQKQEATDKYLSLFNNMNHGFCIIKVVFNESNQPVDYIFLEKNPAFERLTGLKEAEGKGILELLPYLEPSWFEKFGRVARTRQSVRFEGKTCSSAHELWYDVHAFPIDDPKEDHVAVLFNDITNRKKRGEHFRNMLEKLVKERTTELQESRDFIKHITDTIPDILYVINLNDRKITYVSRGIYSLGFKPEEIYELGPAVFGYLVHPDEYDERINNIMQMASLKNDEIRGTEFRIRDAAGKWHWVNNRTTVFKRDEEKQPTEILGILQDITVKKEAEAAYFKEKNKSQELKRLNDIMDTFVFAAAHDLKAPISNLILLTNAIDATEETEKKLELQKKYMPVIDTLNRTITGMINVLSIEKKTVTGIKKIRFKDVFDHVLKELDNQIKEADALIMTSFRYCPTIIYNESYLISIFRNIISNAIKYRSSERRPMIKISTDYSGDYIMVTFRDNGIGIDLEKFRGELFKPFKRLSFGSEGTGIGLHLVKSIVTKNGGKIEVNSVPGEGTAFRIFLVGYKKD